MMLKNYTLTNIGQLMGILPKETLLLKGEEMGHINALHNAYVEVVDGKIQSFGIMDNCPETDHQIVNMHGDWLMPGFVDSHTHMVFASSRHNEYVMRLQGKTYEDIAAEGGGILNSAKKLQAIDEDTLFKKALKYAEEAIASGTLALEIKSGYGLSVEGELKMLRVIKKLKETSSMMIKSTFLGAHTFPAAFKEDHEGYINSIINEMLPVIAAEKLADYIDVFCETGFFSPEETDKICKAGAAYGLLPKLHVNQLNSIGGIEAGIKNNALSLDHLETVTENEINLLAESKAVCTLLPSAAFFLRMEYQPARKLIDAGAAIALASDLNPGSSPSGNMNFVISLSCIQMRMTPEESINAATMNGAYAMEVHSEAGSITKGKVANLIITKSVPSLTYLPYAFGSNLIDKVMIRGTFI